MRWLPFDAIAGKLRQVIWFGGEGEGGSGCEDLPDKTLGCLASIAVDSTISARPSVASLEAHILIIVDVSHKKHWRRIVV